MAVAARKHHVTAPTKGTDTASRETVQRVDVAHHGRDDSLEMQLLTSVQHSLHAVQAANAASRIARTARSIAKPVQPDSTPQRPLPTQLKTLDTAKPKTVPVASAAKPVSATDDKSTQNSARVQIRLSKKLVRILAAFHKAGQKPSNVIENTMWRDARIQDAATILGMTVPVHQTQEKHKR
ncbi:MAG: hypothetical protein WAO83_11565 [Fuerstiella sp.]